MNKEKNTTINIPEVNEIAKKVINRCLLYGYELEPIKLQYLLILTHGKMLAMYNKPLFNQNICIKDNELFIDEINNNLSTYLNLCNEQIKEYSILNKKEEQIVTEILKTYGAFSLEHLKNTRELLVLNEIYNNQTNIIPNELIKEIFLYYTFYEYINPIKNETQFTRSLKNEY